MSDDNENDPEDKIRSILRGLTVREAKILKERFGIELSQDVDLEEIGKLFDITRKRIHEIEQKALSKLKSKKEEVESCSFCGKPKNQVGRLISSSIKHAFICDVCIREAMGILDE